MSTLTPLIEAWDEGHREFFIALNGCPDGDLWERANPRLLSVDELAGHVAYWQAVWALGDGSDKPDIEKLPIKSPLVDHAFRYYTINIDQPFQSSLTTEEVIEEVKRVHDAARAAVNGKKKDDAFSGIWRNVGQSRPVPGIPSCLPHRAGLLSQAPIGARNRR